MSRIRLDLSQVLKQDSNPRIWLYLTEEFSSAQDIITSLKKKYLELGQLEICLSLEDFIIPAEVSINIFTKDDIVKVSAVKRNTIEKRKIPTFERQTRDTNERKELVSYPSTNTSASAHSSIILSEANISTTGVSAAEEDSCPPHHEPLQWSEEFSKFLNCGQDECHGNMDSQISSELHSNNQSSDRVCKVASKVMSSVPSLNTEDLKLNRISSVKESAEDVDESLQNLSISSITDYTLDSDRIMVRKKRTDYLPWYNSSVSLSSVKEAKRTQCEAIKKRHEEELGSSWTVGNTYKQQYYETGHEDMMWVFSNTQVLVEINSFMQVSSVLFLIHNLV